jgi:hypothetical protein
LKKRARRRNLLQASVLYLALHIAGAIAVYDDPADLLADLDRSPPDAH